MVADDSDTPLFFLVGVHFCLLDELPLPPLDMRRSFHLPNLFAMAESGVPRRDDDEELRFELEPFKFS